ncbi:hypothetical protein [Priestia aryabhattai]
MLDSKKILKKLGYKNEIYWIVKSFISSPSEFCDIIQEVHNLKKTKLAHYKSLIDYEVVPTLKYISQDYYANPDDYKEYEVSSI